MLRLRTILLLALLILSTASIFSVLAYPLVQAPQLDAKENLVLSEAFHQGTHATQPMYRASLYPALLSLMGPPGVRLQAALALGMLLHLTNGVLAFLIGRRLFHSDPAGFIAAAVVLLNPFCIFFSLQILDVTLATTLFLGAILMGLTAPKSIGNLALAGLLLALAAAVRPHFIPAVLVAPFALLVCLPDGRFRAFALWIPAVLVFLLQGAFNYHLSGDFRILPWQGAYNLWAANKPGANGLYFKQSVDVSGRGNAENPAKVESIYLYGQAHPEEEPPYPIDAMNAYWRGKFIDHVLENPLQVAKLWLFKAYAVVNSHEQYNNLTFSFHKDRIPLLRYNPPNWGILFILGTLGLIQLFRERPRWAVALLLLILAYTSTLILFYASARFRLPLVPLMAILAGGSVGWFRDLHHDRRRLVATIGIVLITGFLTYSSFAGIRNRDTHVQDRLLMANANADLGRDAAAARWAREVLADHPDRREAQRIYTISYFNMALLGNPGRAAFGNWRDQRTWVRQNPPTDLVQDAVLGVFYWQWGERERATRLWKEIHRKSKAPLAGACLVATHSADLKSADPALVTALKNLLTEPTD